MLYVTLTFKNTKKIFKKKATFYRFLPVMATPSSILAWRTPWTKEPGKLQFIGSQRVRHD